ncbi:MAG TPA: hypothetical protein VMT82_10300 [candidate division Zixibacteria bacterium]|nr:hypothetical protein [candidate division Zixibacteria bacterium]
MPDFRTLGVLSFAAVLEAGGDAIIRKALHASAGPWRIGLFGVAAGVLFAYGYLVNASTWDFGRLLGLYVVFFFIISQLLSRWIMGHWPSRGVFMGGVLIVLGGAIIWLKGS